VDQLKNGTPLDAFDYIVLFKGLKSMEINISLSNLDHFMDFEAPMSDKWLDYMLLHTFAQKCCLYWRRNNAVGEKILQT
jgi:hypothetical protein